MKKGFIITKIQGKEALAHLRNIKLCLQSTQVDGTNTFCAAIDEITSLVSISKPSPKSSIPAFS